MFGDATDTDGLVDMEALLSMLTGDIVGTDTVDPLFGDATDIDELADVEPSLLTSSVNMVD